MASNELRKAILEADDIETEVVDVPQWGVKVEVRGMTSKERAKLLRSTTVDGQVDFNRWFPDLLIATIHDPESGDRIFTQADRDALNQKSGAAISHLADVAARLSGLGDSDLTDAKEELSEGIPSHDST